MPQRIQLKRSKGWRKPEGAIVVARPSKFGNPYPHVQIIAIKGALQDGALRGCDLACWCKLSELCHADVLLELANPDGA